jgi:amphi-Trp domain-containing protein
MASRSKENEMSKHGTGKHEVKASGIVDRERVIGYVEDFLSSLKHGRVVVTCGDDHMTVNLPERVELEIEAEHDDGKHELSLELSWHDHMKAREIEHLKISSEEPAAAEGPLEHVRTESARHEHRASWEI